MFELGIVCSSTTTPDTITCFQGTISPTTVWMEMLLELFSEYNHQNFKIYRLKKVTNK